MYEVYQFMLLLVGTTMATAVVVLFVFFIVFFLRMIWEEFK